MPIDNCQHRFQDLVDTLPMHIHSLNAATRYNLGDFAEPGVGYRSLIKKFSPLESSDFMGLYVLYENDIPTYVGISRKVIARLKQHVTGRTHNDASLAFKMAYGSANMIGRRNELMMNPDFIVRFVAMKEHLCTMKVSFVEVENDLELYLLEVYAAMHYDTSKWNTFRTH